MDKVWLVTGSASGLGRNIAEAVLESGDQLVATARDPRRLDGLVNKFCQRVRAVSRLPDGRAMSVKSKSKRCHRPGLLFGDA